MEERRLLELNDCCGLLEFKFLQFKFSPPQPWQFIHLKLHADTPRLTFRVLKKLIYWRFQPKVFKCFIRIVYFIKPAAERERGRTVKLA